MINVTINALTEWLHRDKKVLMLSSSVVCLLFTISILADTSVTDIIIRWCILFCSTCQGVPKVRFSNFPFDEHFYYFHMKFQRDVYGSTEYMYLEFHLPVCPLGLWLFVEAWRGIRHVAFRAPDDPFLAFFHLVRSSHLIRPLTRSFFSD